MVLHDTHHRVSTRCHLLQVGDVVLFYTSEAWRSDLPRESNPRWSGNATVDDYELWDVVEVRRRERRLTLRRGEAEEVVTWSDGRNILTALAEGPDPLYASTEALREQGWALALPT